MRMKRQLAFLLMGLAAAAIIVGAYQQGGSRSASAAAGDPGTATFTVSAPAGQQPLSTPFDVTIGLTQFTGSAGSPTWGGYDSELSYDSTILDVVSVTRGLCSPAGNWADPLHDPHVVTGCFAQSRSDTGTLDTISFTCVGNGTSPLIMLPRGDASNIFLGSSLFDENSVDFSMTFVNSSVTCGSADTPTFTPTSTPTDTPTPGAPTSTATPTRTATNTPLASTQTAIAGATQTAQANFGGADTATPLPETQTAIAQLTPTATLAPGETPPPSGGGGGAVPSPTRAGGAPGGTITLPNTGTGSDSGIPGMWLIIGGLALAVAGGSLFLTSRRVR